MSDDRDDDDDSTGPIWHEYGKSPLDYVYSALMGFGSTQPMSAAGRYLQTLQRGDAAQITTQAHISEELEAQLRRIQIVSMRPAHG